ncbi:anthranilate/aminodeoxychorismate synthase component II [candidate division KSB1 bacterium]|nr:MAG: anthranilate/aminodeoxychorismate synthase component II [candidate division KSB1 bacterium]RKY81661.1 MAG: anthranilate/aminodeoxychorismate synthase component II [candidate division KSB1 bacterium]
MICVIDNYDSFTYNLVQYLGELGAELRVFRNNEISTEEIARLQPQGLVISPGPGRPKQAGITLEAIKEFAKCFPILGVCLGHQAIAEAFGGKIVQAPSLVHGKTSLIRHNGNGIFQNVANPFVATRYHSLLVEKASLPSCLKISAETDDGLIMGLTHRQLPIYGVQFHPESILTTEGKKILRNFLNVLARESHKL